MRQHLLPAHPHHPHQTTPALLPTPTPPQCHPGGPQEPCHMLHLLSAIPMVPSLTPCLPSSHSYLCPPPTYISVLLPLISLSSSHLYLCPPPTYISVLSHLYLCSLPLASLSLTGGPHGSRHLCAVGRRGLHGGGHPGAPGAGRPPALRVCGPRPAALQGGRGHT
jgi:hypothetical protein